MTERTSVLPCSVLDIEAQEQRRRPGEQDNVSSRADYSNFPSEVAALCFELYLRNCTTVFDPFAGWGERAAAAKYYWMDYVGIDINPVAVQKAREVYGAQHILADARTYDPPAFDGLITCPPYWNLEKYSAAGLDGLKTWAEFLAEYAVVFARAYSAAVPGAVFCIMTGDWRHKGKYFDLTYQTQKVFGGLGAETIDQVIVSRKKISKIKIMIPQALRCGYTVKVHENLSVFRKPVKDDE